MEIGVPLRVVLDGYGLTMEPPVLGVALTRELFAGCSWWQ